MLYIVHDIMVTKTPSLPFVFTILLLCQGNETYKYKDALNQNSLIPIAALFFCILHNAASWFLCFLFWHCMKFCLQCFGSVCVCVCVFARLHTHAKSLQLYLTLCNAIDCSLPGPSVNGIPQARILKWIAMPSSRGSLQFRNRTHVSYISCIGRQVLYN